MCVSTWTPTISVCDSWFIHNYAKIWPFFSFLFQISSWYSMTYRYCVYFDCLDYQGCGIFFQCLIHWITSFSKFLFEDSVQCLFYFVVFRTCLCGSKLYLCVCVYWWEPVLIFMCAKVTSPYVLYILFCLVYIYFLNIYLFSCIGS